MGSGLMNRRDFLLGGLRGALLGLAITSGLSPVKIPEVSFVRGKLRASAIRDFRDEWLRSAAEAFGRNLDRLIFEELERLA